MGARKRVEASGGAARVIGNPLGPDRSTRAAGRLAWRDGPAARGTAGGGVVRRGRRTLRPHPSALPRRPDRTDRRDGARRARRGVGHRHRRPAAAGGGLPRARRRARRPHGRVRADPRRSGRGGDVRGVGASGPRVRRGRRGAGVALGRPGRGGGQGGARAAPRRAARRVLERLRRAPRAGGRVQRGLPPGVARLAGLADHPRRLPHVGRHRRRRHARRVRRSPRSGGSPGSANTPATSGSRRCRRSAGTPRSPPTSGPRWSRGSERRSTRSAAGSSMGYTTLAVVARPSPSPG